MAFTHEDLEAWNVKECAEQRQAAVIALACIAKRRTELPDLPKPDWWKEVAKRMRNVATWYGVAMVIDTDVEAALALPSAESAEGKALTRLALNAEPADWLAGWLADVEAGLAHVVTIGRRCAAKGGWSKEQKSLSNKLANCLVKEHNLISKMQDSLNSRVP